MESKIENYSSKVKALTYHLTKNIYPKIRNTNLVQEEPYKYFFTLLFKTVNALDTANILTNNLIHKPTTTDSLFIILRTTISDLIIYFYLLRASKDDEDLIKNIHRMYFDHIDKTIIEINKFYRSAYQKTEKEVNEKINELKSAKSLFFNSEGEPIYESLKLSISSMVREIVSKKEKGEDLSYLITAKEQYDKFSKYEHFGYLTFDLTRRQFQVERIDEIFNEIFLANKIILYYVDNLVTVWVKKDEKEYIAFNELKNIISEFKE